MPKRPERPIRTRPLATSRPTTRKPSARPDVEPVAAPSEGDGSDGEDVTDKIYATLAAAIAEGALKPGSKILEDAIADHFGVSRTVARGALGILQRDHLLERKRNRGTFVAEPSIVEAQQLFQARRSLERMMLEWVVASATPADLARLEEMTAEEDRIHHGDDEAEKHGLAGHFHLELARVAGNEVMTELLGKVLARISLVMTLYEADPHDDCGADHHRAILAAVRDRNLAGAQNLMEEHLIDIESRVRLTQVQGDRHAFLSVLQAFSPGN